MAVSRYFYKKLANGKMSPNPTYLGAKAEYVTIEPASGEELLDAQSEFERMWQMDTQLNQRLTDEIKNRVDADLAEKKTREEADTAEANARTKAVEDEAKIREEADTKITGNLTKEIDDRKAAINKEVNDRNDAIENAIDKLDLTNQLNGLADDIAALEEKLLYTAAEDETAIVENRILNLEVKTYKYILIYCEYNGKRMPVYQVLADGKSSEIIYHSLGESGICYIKMDMSVANNQLTISNIVNSSDTAEFKILNIYGCV